MLSSITNLLSEYEEKMRLNLKKTLIFLNVLTLFYILVQPSVAHEFWIEPKKYSLKPSDVLSAALFVGQDFSGYEQPYIQNNFSRFELVSTNAIQPIRGRIGDRPALNIFPKNSGLSAIIYQSTPTQLTYNDFNKFVTFSEEKGFPNIPKQHLAENLPKTGFKEIYTRFAKSIITIHNNKGSDKLSGMELEWVMGKSDLSNANTTPIKFSLYYKGIAKADALVTVFSKDALGKVNKTTGSTNNKGVFILTPSVDTRYLIDSVIIRKNAPSSAPDAAIWESLWASITFKTAS
jgi:hypothetical protein